MQNLALNHPPFEMLPSELAQQRFGLLDYIELFSSDHMGLPRRILLHQGDLELSQLTSAELAPHIDFLIIEGNLRASVGIDIRNIEDGLIGMFVTGNVETPVFTMGDTEIVILGKLKVGRYLHTPATDYEQGRLWVGGQASIPLIIQESLNPELCLSDLSNQGWYTFEQRLRGWPARFFDSEEMNYVTDIAALVAHIEADLQKEPADQENYDWQGALSFSASRYASNEQLHLAAWLHGALEVLPAAYFAGDLSRIKSIEIRDMPLREFPMDLLRCHNLEQLHIQNSLSYLPSLPDLSVLTKLKCLVLDGGGNHEEKRPPNQVALLKQILAMPFQALDYLELNRWGEVRQPAKKQDKILRPKLSASDLQGIGRLTCLKGLGLYANGLQDLPNDFFDLAQINYLRLIEDFDAKLKKKVRKSFPDAEIEFA